MGPSEFGEKLRLEREGRQTPIEEIAARSQVDLRYLEALERGDFGALPGPAIGKLYVRFYAEILEFDADEWVSRYDRAQQLSRRPHRAPRRRRDPRPVEAAIARWRASRSAEHAARSNDEPSADGESEAPPVPTEPAPEPAAQAETEPSPLSPAAAGQDEDEQRIPAEPFASAHNEPAAWESVLGSSRPRIVVRPRVSGAVAIGIAAVILIFGGAALVSMITAPGASDDRDESAVKGEAGASPEPPAALHSTVESSDRPGTMPAPEEAAGPDGSDEPMVTQDSASEGPTVTEFAVGRSVRDNRLVDPANEFQEGSAVYFFTRVRGGAKGQRIRHVWLRGGRTVQAIELALGGAHWRTHSRKTLYGLGAWSVEARDLDGRVLARVEFTCVPKR